LTSIERSTDNPARSWAAGTETRNAWGNTVRTAFVAVVIALLGLVASAARAAEDVVIGAGFVLSGDFASYGSDAKIGVDLAVDELNAAGGVLGRRLKVEYVDTGADRAKAVAHYRKFASRPEVAMFLSISSVEFVALDPVATEAKLPFISVGSAAPFPKFSPYSFRIQLIVDKAMGPVLGRLKELRGIKTVGVMYATDNTYNVGEMESVKATAPTAGLQLFDVESFKRGDQDFSLQITRIKAREPDLLYVAATTDEAALIISQARALGLKSLILGGAGFNDPRIADLPGKAARGVMTFFPFDATDPRPIVQSFVRLYKAKYGPDKTPPAYVALGYDAARLVADAARRAGSTDREAVRKALGSTKRLEGVNGFFSYEGSGDNLEQKPNIFVMGDKGYERLTK
jgi:branched-chain amino acid transport system substrate-binding protein